MSLTGHVSTIKRHMCKAKNARSQGDESRYQHEKHHANIALRGLKNEASKLTDKQIQRDCSEALNILKMSPGLLDHYNHYILKLSKS